MKPEPIKILIAEDDCSSREMLSEMLQSWGYEVISARNGAEALQKMEESRPELIVCDIHMPLLDGLGMVQALRRQDDFANLPVIALTAGGAQDPGAIASAGFTTYQTKPVNSALLRKNIERLLQKGNKDSTYQR